MPRYILQSEKLKGRVLLDFTTEGLVKGFTIEAEQDVTEKFVKWMFRNFPFHVKGLQLKLFTDLFTISEVKQGLNFSDFWEAYDYKVGKKNRTERLWDAMTEAERAQAMASISKYNLYLAQHPGIEKAYPDTWLNQRRWENQYKLS